MKKIKSTKGITLISLVVIIIILLILAGVTIATLIGDNGLINKARDSKIKTGIESIKEEIQTDILAKQIESNGNISDDSLRKILEKYGTLSEEAKLTNKTLTTTKEKYEIKVSDIFKETTVNDGHKEPTLTTVANEPDISGFNKSNTYYVSWDLTNSPYKINEDTNLNGIAPSNWYDYTEGVNHWANVKTTGGGNECYWVWIPRYAYKVPTKGGTEEKIDIKFLNEKTNIPIGEMVAITNTTPTLGEWVVHPAFTNTGNGGLGNLTGIWVAKYEASSSNVNTINLENGTLTGDTASLSGSGGGKDTSLQVRVKPNVRSWRKLNVNGIFTVCQNLTKTINGKENSLVGSTNLDSHMMKNIEWGACAYLSSSKYGKTDSSGNRVRVYNNPYYNNETNYSPITGLAGKTATQVNASTTTDLYKYNTTEGVNASTTGNVYGIYDMAGGAWEYIAGINTDGESNEERSKLWDSNNSKYVDKYTNTTGSQSTYYGNTDKYGDAVYETSSSGNSNAGSWDSCDSYFPYSSYPIFIRGGPACDGSNAAVFAFNDNSGGEDISCSFRPVVISSYFDAH